MDKLPDTTFVTGPQELKAAEETPARPEEISFDDFLKLDLRFGKVTKAESLPKSNKLLCLRVDFGNFERLIVAGVAKSFAVDSLVGGIFLFVVNIPPREIMGMESHGMLLAAGSPQNLVLARPTANSVEGFRVG